mgnify:CR=1 FL=1
MKLKNKLLLSASVASAIFFTGCNTTGGTYVDSQGPDTLVAGNQITITDFYMASDEMVNSLVTSGALDRAPKQPAVLAISRVINDTREQFDTDQLVKKIRVALNRTGKVMTSTTVGFGGNAEDKLAESAAAKEAYLSGDTYSPSSNVDFTLSGKIIQPPKIQDGSRRQNSYIFQLNLTEIKSGLAVWEDEKTITKQYKKSSIG